MAKATHEQLEALHGALAAAMKQTLESGDATASAWKEVREFLKDNGVDLSTTPNDANDVGELLDDLPFTDNVHRL